MVFKLWITRIEFNTKKEWTTESHNDTDEISMYFSKWNKSVHKCFYCIIPFIVVQLLSCVLLFATCGFLSFTISWSLLKFMSIELVMPFNHLILCLPLLLLPSAFPSIRVFSNESALGIEWPKYWSFSISSSNEYSGLMSFRADWFDLPVVQETLKSLLQHNWKASILQHSACFRAQLSHPNMTTE